MTLPDWTKQQHGKPGPCHYRCGHDAAMNEPGKPWKAHKVCAERAADPDRVEPVITPWDGAEGGSKAEPQALGCGTPTPGQSPGRACGGFGDRLGCQLCPRSPSYWRNGLPADIRAALPPEPSFGGA